jgi:hypothetical protein
VETPNAWHFIAKYYFCYTMKIEQLRATMAAKKYAFFEGGEYNLNIVGIRNSSTGNKVTNAFDDKLVVAYQVAGAWVIKEYPITTDNGGGTARLVCNQYRGSHAIGLHQGKYEALRQVAPVTVYRDFTKDGIYQTDKTETGVFGINIHKAGVDSTRVDDWSHGCQVFKRVADFNEFMLLAKKAAALHGNRFSYTLIESKDLVNLLD